ncbi:RCC1/BLIP-II [Cryphonectria parasitica EP155]|uniref:RCC1/BLIP-II n=1 Tax=Cryphonectria parasitica (strain ATCC 38755 / EP155) TaxID=660469 RepID=A0A9P4Y7Z3_CRYP1|nr:RCC1/BLIP-II [Cryphonectria parasitica EP155]KAF3768639.1 RCC1/BLIP-II [Cryphonectria parasitica EP155]
MSRYGVKSVAAGPYHSLAVDNKDRVFAWGMNNFGQAGYASNAGADSAELPYPMQIKPLSKQGIEQMAAGAHHSAAVTKDGRYLVWGRIDGGHLGLKLSQEQIDNPKVVRKDEYEKPRILLEPTAVPNLGKAAYIACSTGHTIFVNRDGKAFASGFGSQLQLGNGKDDDVEVAEEVKAKSLEGVKLSWCGTGGQFSMVAAPGVVKQVNGHK